MFVMAILVHDECILNFIVTHFYFSILFLFFKFIFLFYLSIFNFYLLLFYFIQFFTMAAMGHHKADSYS